MSKFNNVQYVLKKTNQLLEEINHDNLVTDYHLHHKIQFWDDKVEKLLKKNVIARIFKSKSYDELKTMHNQLKDLVYHIEELASHKYCIHCSFYRKKRNNLELCIHTDNVNGEFGELWTKDPIAVRRSICRGIDFKKRSPYSDTDL
jgi:uncharacterized protein YcbK (DUF882 family)